MTTHLHFHPHFHPHARPPVPLLRFAIEHPNAGDWLLLTAWTLAALLLWFWGS